MKKVLILNLLALATLSQIEEASATIVRSGVTSAKVMLYGVYTTADPLCATGLVATVPLSTTASPFEMTQSPTIGAGQIPAGGINCVIMVMQNRFDSVVAAGTYTTTTTSGNYTYSDSACNAGFTGTKQAICNGPTNYGNGVVAGKSVNWPAQIVTDAAAIGLTLTTTCAGTTADTIALYLSTASSCYGQNAKDASITGCIVSGNSTNNPWQAPTSTSDTAHGIHLATVPASTSYTFVVDPTGAFGATSNNGTPSCGNVSAPLFSFHN